MWVYCTSDAFSRLMLGFPVQRLPHLFGDQVTISRFRGRKWGHSACDLRFVERCYAAGHHTAIVEDEWRDDVPALRLRHPQLVTT